MNKTIQVLLVITMLFGFSTAAFSGQGFYVGGSLGAALLNDIDVTVPYEGRSVDATFTTNVGPVLSGAVGFSFENNFRPEIEIEYQVNNFDEIEVAGVGKANLSGDMSRLGLFANGYYDFKSSGKVTPFIGAGIGYVKVNVNDLGLDGSADTDDSDDTGFAFHLDVGVSYDITKKVSIDLRYRYVDMFDLDPDSTSSNTYVGVRYFF